MELCTRARQQHMQDEGLGMNSARFGVSGCQMSVAKAAGVAGKKRVAFPHPTCVAGVADIPEDRRGIVHACTRAPRQQHMQDEGLGMNSARFGVSGCQLSVAVAEGVAGKREWPALIPHVLLAWQTSRPLSWIVATINCLHFSS